MEDRRIKVSGPSQLIPASSWPIDRSATRDAFLMPVSVQSNTSKSQIGNAAIRWSDHGRGDSRSGKKDTTLDAALRWRLHQRYFGNCLDGNQKRRGGVVKTKNAGGDAQQFVAMYM